MRTVSLCTGYGGIELGLALAGVHTQLLCVADNDPAAAAVLERRWPQVANVGDIRDANFTGLGPVDLLAAGYPCQPMSKAGKKLGTSDGRWLADDVLGAVRTIRPRHVLLENVPGHLRVGFGHLLAGLAEAGFDADWCHLRACEVGAPHRRGRVFIHAFASDTDGAAGRQRGFAAP